MDEIFRAARFIKPNIPFEPAFSGKNYAPMFRKTVRLDKLGSARLYVCGLGYAYYYINGRAVSADLFTSAVSNYDKTLWYHSYDVTDMLCEGDNTFAVICGNGWYNEDIPTVWKHYTATWRDLPKFILSLQADGRELLKSDGTWRCLPNSAIYFNALRSGEYFDSRLYDEAWNTVDFDDSAWENAVIDACPPKGVFRECLCEPIREERVLDARSVNSLGGGIYVFDMGENVSGYIRLTVYGLSQQTLTIRYGEMLKDDGSIDREGLKRFYPSSEFQTDRFICSDKKMTWSPRFTYHGFRYIQLEGVENISDVTVQAVFVHQAVERRTSFSCSEELLNRLFDAGIRTCYSNMFYQPTDCPTREKMGWTNDVHMSCEQFFTNFKIDGLFRKWLTDIYDSMREDGALPGVIPTPGYGYKWGNGPLSDGILFEMPYRLYLHSGDKSPLIEALPYFERYFSFLRSRENESGWVDFGLADWAGVGRLEDISLHFINAVLQYKFYGIARLAAELAEDCALSERYAYCMERLKSRIIRYWITDVGTCAINEMTAVALLICFELYEEREPLRQQLKALVKKNGFHHHCGMLGMRYLYDALCTCNLQEHAYKIITAKDFPSYSFWQQSCDTTLWEYWSLQKGGEYNSKNHHLYSDVLSWMIKNILGIRHSRTEPNQPEIRIEPYYFKELSFARGSYEADSGAVSVSWRREDTRVRLDIEITGELRVCYADNVLSKGSYSFTVCPQA